MTLILTPILSSQSNGCDYCLTPKLYGSLFHCPLIIVLSVFQLLGLPKKCTTSCFNIPCLRRMILYYHCYATQRTYTNSNHNLNHNSAGIDKQNKQINKQQQHKRIGCGTLFRKTQLYVYYIIITVTCHYNRQASCDRMDPLCRQRHLSGYRSRT